jgi:Flp pilus assembly secretin CpaC
MLLQQLQFYTSLASEREIAVLGMQNARDARAIFALCSPFRAKLPFQEYQYRVCAMSLTRSIAAFVLGFLLTGGPALAETTEPISVKVNMARILRISAPAATVIIGNPGVADITIQDPQTLVLTGRSYGTTNLIVLDAAGNPVADTIVSVVQGQAEMVTVYMGSARQTLACDPECQPTIMLGDDQSFSANTFASSSLIDQAARPRQ